MRNLSRITYRLWHLLEKPAVTEFRKTLDGKINQGFFCRGIRYVHHSQIPVKGSAFIRLSKTQKKIILVLLFSVSLGLLFFWHTAIIVLIALLSAVYFADLLLHFFLILLSFRKQPEITVDSKELIVQKDKKLPRYTILCPLYHEASVVAQFSKAIKKMDYPKRKLQVILLTESEDEETRQTIKNLDLPSYFEEVVVPYSLPKTKPKALNFGLRHAKGEYITVYDAEDIPETTQLKKSVIAFSKLTPRSICLQAKLHFYNP